MAETLVIAAKGLRTNPGASGDAAQDGLTLATNVVLNRDGVWEPRRGVSRLGAAFTDGTDPAVLDHCGAFRDQLVLHSKSGRVYLVDASSGAGSVLASRFVPSSGEFVSFEAAQSLFISDPVNGFSRLDSPTATPEPAGMSRGLDARASLVADQTAGPPTEQTALRADSQVAYRVLFGKRDANGRLIVGSPSGRALVVNGAYAALTGELERKGATSTVTAKWPKHGLAVGEWVVVATTETNFAAGTYAVVGVTSVDEFTYVDASSTTISKSVTGHLLARRHRDVSVAAAIPSGLPADAVVQFYRSISSVSYDVEPTDELYLAYESTIPSPAVITTLARTGTTVTATTTAPHNLWAGVEAIIPNGASGNAGRVVAVGPGVVANTTDGTTWTPGTGGGVAVAYDGAGHWVAVNGATAYYSSNGTSWTAGTGACAGLTGVAYGNGVWVAIGYDAGAASARVRISEDNGATWKTVTAATGWFGFFTGGNGDTSPGLSEPHTIIFAFGRFVAVGWDYVSQSLRSSTSTNGLTWQLAAAVTQAARVYSPTVNNLLPPNAGTPTASPICAYQGWAGGFWSLRPEWTDLGGGYSISYSGGGSSGTITWPTTASGFINDGSVYLYPNNSQYPQAKAGRIRTALTGLSGWYRLTFDVSGYKTPGGKFGNLHMRLGLGPFGAGLGNGKDDTIRVDLSTVATKSYDVFVQGSILWIDFENADDLPHTYDNALAEFDRATGEPRWPGITVNNVKLVSLTAPSATWSVATDGSSITAACTDRQVWRSVDGQSWGRLGNVAASGTVNGVAWSPIIGKWLALGSGLGGGTKPYSSADGVTWAAVTTAPAGSYYAAADIGSLCVAVGDANLAASSPDGVTWTQRTIGTGSWRAVAVDKSTSIPGGLYTLTGPATPGTGVSTFTFETAASGTVASTSAPQPVTPVSVGILDTLPEAQLGAALYTNPSQEGMLASHEPTPDATGATVFRDHVFFSRPQRAPAMLVSLLTVGASGLQSGHLVKLAGGVVTAGAAENVATRVFKVFSTGDGLDVYRTTQSLCRVINRNPSLGVAAIPASGTGTTNQGAFVLQALSVGASVSFEVSAAPTAWSPSRPTTLAPQRADNVLAFSEPGIPDAVPVFNELVVGKDGKKILSTRALREVLIVLKEDGVFRVTGSSKADFSVEPIDLTTFIVNGPSAAVLGNACYALSTGGLVRITENNVEGISDHDVADLIADALTPAMRSTTAALAVGCGYESDQTYTLWYPRFPSSTVPDRALSYSTLTGQWFARDDGFSSALIRSVDDRLYAVRDNRLYSERKSWDRTDYADDLVSSPTLISVSSVAISVSVSSVAGIAVGDAVVQGASWATVLGIDFAQNVLKLDRVDGFDPAGDTFNVYRAIAVSMEWRPAYTPGQPGTMMHARELGLVFKDCQLSRAQVTFSSDLSRGAAEVVLEGDALGVADETPGDQPRTLRLLVTPQHQRCSQLVVGFRHANAFRPFQLEALQLTYRRIGEKVSH